ncbi:MAG: hypothetical protein AB8B79_13110 [Granulosicoccus sp.]
MSSIVEEAGFLVAAKANSRLTPNFKAKEYFSSDGSLFIHRDVISGVQMLRDIVGPLSVDSVRPRSIDKGLGVSLVAKDADNLWASAKRLKKEGLFNKVVQLSSSAVVVSVSKPSRKSTLKPVFAFDCGLQVVASYETRGNPYEQVTGNFDGAGLSFGVIQFNFKSGTLQRLFELFYLADPDALQACFDTPERFDELSRIVKGSQSKAIKWGDSISIGAGKSKVTAPWNKCFRAMGRVEQFKQIQMNFAYEKYGQLMLSTLAFLEGLSDVQIRNHRCLTAIFDMCIQQGGHGRARNEIKKRVIDENPRDEITLTHITVEERAKKANVVYRADCLSRRLGILYREPRSITLEGHTARRSNNKLYLVRDVAVSGVDGYLSPLPLRDTD